MIRRTHAQQVGPAARIAAFAEATEVYAESLEDPDLANVYWGKSLGLWQAFQILTAEGQATEGRRSRDSSANCGPGRADLMGPCASTRPAVSPTATTSPGW
ncbi:MAG: hypothetical protein ACRD0S_02105 [Acidimicrobiales bacterium]